MTDYQLVIQKLADEAYAQANSKPEIQEALKAYPAEDRGMQLRSDIADAILNT